MSRITISDLEKYLWGSAIILRGSMAAGSYKNYIFPLLFYKRICDVYDEEYTAALKESGGDVDYAKFAENHRFQVPEDAHWNKIREVSMNIGPAIQKALRDIERANDELLSGVFGDAAWTNKERLPDQLLKELLEHFNSQILTIENCPEDELGNGYEYLIKQFADDSGHTAQEFYTNRTVVHLMTELLKPQSDETIYDPTCGSAGMLISSIAYLKEQNKEWRTVELYGQELNILTSAIGRMNLFLHGVENFKIVQGDT
ncbi:MAG: class I SAM-dependent DNA methyltransferase, partial [Bacillota bacterium]